MRDDVSLKNSEENTLKTNTRIRAPSHLTDATKAWYASVCRDYALEGHHLRLLQLAAEAWDRCQQAREILARDGITSRGRRLKLSKISFIRSPENPESTPKNLRP